MTIDIQNILITILCAAFGVISSLLVYIWNKTLNLDKEEKIKFYTALSSVQDKLTEINKNQSEAGMRISGLMSEIKLLSKETSKIEVNIDKFASSISSIENRLSRIEEWRTMIAEEIELLKELVNRR